MRDYSITLGAGERRRVPTQAFGYSSWTVITAPDDVVLLFDDGTSFLTARAGDGCDGEPFDSMEIESATAQTVVIRVGTGAARVGETVNVNASAQVEVGNSNPAIADVNAGAAAKTLIAPANANRKALIVKSVASNPTEGVRVGNNATVAAAAGALLDAGESITIESTAAVYVWNSSATTAALMTMTEIEHL